MTVICNYPSKKYMQENAIGQSFDGYDPSIFGNRIEPGATFVVCNRPQIDGRGKRLAVRFDLRTKTGKLAAVREFFATVTLDQDMKISQVR